MPAVRGVSTRGRGGDQPGCRRRVRVRQVDARRHRAPAHPQDAVVTGRVLLDGEDVLAMSLGRLRAVRWAEASIVFQGRCTPSTRCSGSAGRSASRSSCTTPCPTRRASTAGRRAAVRRGAAGPARAVLPAPALGRPEAAGDDCDGAGLPAAADRGRRADHRPRRDGAGPGAGPDVRAGARPRRRPDRHQPRPVGAATTCDRVAVMYAGRVVEQGRAEDVLHRARHPYTRAVAAFPTIGDPAAASPRAASRRPALAGRPAARLPVPPALRRGDRTAAAPRTCRLRQARPDGRCP